MARVQESWREISKGGAEDGWGGLSVRTWTCGCKLESQKEIKIKTSGERLSCFAIHASRNTAPRDRSLLQDSRIFFIKDAGAVMHRSPTGVDSCSGLV